MPPKRDAGDGGGGGGAAKKSRLSQKTAAEFFAENKQFAGEYTPAGCASAAPVRVSHRRRARPPAHTLTRAPRAPRARNPFSCVIAGFDNPGKSLYTSIRELVENSLDASEAIGVLPEVSRPGTRGSFAGPC